jgi:hypothetical protein
VNHEGKVVWLGHPIDVQDAVIIALARAREAKEAVAAKAAAAAEADADAVADKEWVKVPKTDDNGEPADVSSQWAEDQDASDKKAL